MQARSTTENLTTYSVATDYQDESHTRHHGSDIFKASSLQFEAGQSASNVSTEVGHMVDRRPIVIITTPDSLDIRPRDRVSEYERASSTKDCKINEGPGFTVIQSVKRVSKDFLSVVDLPNGIISTVISIDVETNNYCAQRS